MKKREREREKQGETKAERADSIIVSDICSLTRFVQVVSLDPIILDLSLDCNQTSLLSMQVVRFLLVLPFADARHIEHNQRLSWRWWDEFDAFVLVPRVP